MFSARTHYLLYEPISSLNKASYTGSGGLRAPALIRHGETADVTFTSQQLRSALFYWKRGQKNV